MSDLAEASMPLLQMLATVQEEQSLGHLQDLTSPVLGKLKEALIFTRLANAQRRAFGSRTVVLEGQSGQEEEPCNLWPPCFDVLSYFLPGLRNCQLHLGWFEEARLLVMAYKVHHGPCSGCRRCSSSMQKLAPKYVAMTRSSRPCSHCLKCSTDC